MRFAGPTTPKITQVLISYKAESCLDQNRPTKPFSPPSKPCQPSKPTFSTSNSKAFSPTCPPSCQPIGNSQHGQSYIAFEASIALAALENVGAVGMARAGHSLACRPQAKANIYAVLPPAAPGKASGALLENKCRKRTCLMLPEAFKLFLFECDLDVRSNKLLTGSCQSCE